MIMTWLFYYEFGQIIIQYNLNCTFNYNKIRYELVIQCYCFSNWCIKLFQFMLQSKLLLSQKIIFQYVAINKTATFWYSSMHHILSYDIDLYASLSHFGYFWVFYLHFKAQNDLPLILVLIKVLYFLDVFGMSKCRI